jgi:hypothetical protein
VPCTRTDIGKKKAFTLDAMDLNQNIFEAKIEGSDKKLFFRLCKLLESPKTNVDQSCRDEESTIFMTDLNIDQTTSCHAVTPKLKNKSTIWDYKIDYKP